MHHRVCLRMLAARSPDTGSPLEGVAYFQCWSLDASSRRISGVVNQAAGKLTCECSYLSQSRPVLSRLRGRVAEPRACQGPVLGF